MATTSPNHLFWCYHLEGMALVPPSSVCLRSFSHLSIDISYLKFYGRTSGLTQQNYLTILVGGFNPLKNISQLGLLFPIYGKINMFLTLDASVNHVQELVWKFLQHRSRGWSTMAIEPPKCCVFHHWKSPQKFRRIRHPRHLHQGTSSRMSCDAWSTAGYGSVSPWYPPVTKIAG